MPKNLYPFNDLALGTKFKYPGNDYVWVKISHSTIAAWDESMKVAHWTGQQICSFDENDDTRKEVIVL
jgi:hypothetical protein